MSVGQHQWLKVQSRPELCLVVGWPAEGVRVFPEVFKAPAKEKSACDELLQLLQRAEQPPRKTRATTGGFRLFVGLPGNERRPRVTVVRAGRQDEASDDDDDDDEDDDGQTICGADSDADVDPNSLAGTLPRGAAQSRQLLPLSRSPATEPSFMQQPARHSGHFAFLPCARACARATFDNWMKVRECCRLAGRSVGSGWPSGRTTRVLGREGGRARPVVRLEVPLGVWLGRVEGWRSEVAADHRVLRRRRRRRRRRRLPAPV